MLGLQGRCYRRLPMHNGAMIPISRRAFILTGASLAALVLAHPLLAGERDTLSLEEFRALSARLTSVSPADLAPDAASRLLSGFLSLGRGPDLDHLADDPATSDDTLATDIVAAWYSGNYQMATGLASIDLPNALLWNALDFTKSPGVCGGAMGYWGDPPAS